MESYVPTLHLHMHIVTKPRILKCSKVKVIMLVTVHTCDQAPELTDVMIININRIYRPLKLFLCFFYAVVNIDEILGSVFLEWLLVSEIIESLADLIALCIGKLRYVRTYDLFLCYDFLAYCFVQPGDSIKFLFFTIDEFCIFCSLDCYTVGSSDRWRSSFTTLKFRRLSSTSRSRGQHKTHTSWSLGKQLRTPPPPLAFLRRNSQGAW